MTKESQFQSKVLSYLKSKGCLTLKLTPMPGIPTGIPDIFFFKEGFWGAIECKASRSASFRPLQKEWVANLDTMSWARVAYPENWLSIRDELEAIL